MKHGSGFTSEQWLSGLIPEIQSARCVLASADRLLRQEGTLERDLDAVLATYSIGVERLMKLALGASAVSKGQGWPTKMGSTRAGWGHALDEMDQRLRTEIRETVRARHLNNKMLESWVCTLDNDPVWAQVIIALRNYADAGRYHHLDQVAGRAVASKSSLEMWDRVERALVRDNAELQALEQQIDKGLPFSRFERELRSGVADVIKRWVTIVCMFGFHGVLGDDWRVIAADVMPDDCISVQILPMCEYAMTHSG